MGFIAAGWLGIYFLTQPFRQVESVWALLCAGSGAIAAGGGYAMATDAVEDSSMHGLALWVILWWRRCVLLMWAVEGVDACDHGAGQSTQRLADELGGRRC